MGIRNEPGSYKDPRGGVFYHHGKVCRWIADDADRFYRDLVAGPLFKKLVEAHLFVPTSPIEFNADDDVQKRFGPKAVFFEHRRIEFLSYPYEWSASMLVEAALLTLDLQERLLADRLTLKDGTPFNIQFEQARPLFIDLGSIERASTNGVWIAYDQFCRCFLYPLLSFHLGASSLPFGHPSRLDGLTLEETVRSLGLRPFWRYGLVFDYLLPALLTKLQGLKKPVSRRKVSLDRTFENSAEIQAHTVRRLRRFFERLRPRADSGDWVDYERTCTYSEEASASKKRFVEDALKSDGVRRVLDLGSNTGEYSMLAADRSCKVVAVDSDHASVDALFLWAKGRKADVLPLCLDIGNPPAPAGWFNEERAGFLGRAKERFDCVLALALVHHLLVTGRIPLSEIARLLRHLTSRLVVVEYVNPSDRMFQELLRYRTESYAAVTQTAFEERMSERFSILKKEALKVPEQSMDRCLYLMEAR